MKYKFLFILILLLIPALANAQERVLPNRPFSTLNTSPGFITINEVTYGSGLSGKTYPYSQHFFGFTSVNGYQINRNFIVAAGAGAYFYESGLLIPVFLDLRYYFNISSLTPYIFSDGGLLLNVSDLNTTKLFINPGIGVRYALNRTTAFNLGAGILAQVDGTVRESFLNLKLGIVYKFLRAILNVAEGCLEQRLEGKPCQGRKEYKWHRKSGKKLGILYG